MPRPALDFEATLDLLARRKRPSLDDEDLAGSPLETYRAKASPGFLAGVGRILDFPGRKVREALTGKDEATGRDVLSTLGLGDSYNPKGFDLGDVGGFAAEVALDPLNLLAGVGGLTKAGKLATRAGTLANDARAGFSAVRRAENPLVRAAELAKLQEILQARKGVRGELGSLGASRKLAPSWRAQAAEAVPQRSLIQIGAPFASTGATAVRGGPALAGLEKLGGVIKASPPAQFIRRLFDPDVLPTPKTGSDLFGPELLEKDPRARAAFEEAQAARVGANFDALPLQKGLEPLRDASIRAESWRPDDPLEILRDVRESLNVPRKAGRGAAREFARGNTQAAQELMQRGQEARGILRGAQPETIALAQNLRGQGDTLLNEMIETGARAPSSQFRSEVLDHAERVLSPETRELLEKKGLFPEFLGVMSRRLTTKEGSQVRRQTTFAEELTSDFDEFLTQRIPELKGTYFQFDPTKSFPQRWVAGKHAIAAAKLFHGLADNFGKNVHVPGQTIPLEEFLTRGPLHKYKGMTIPRDADRARKVLEAAGLGGRGIPRDIAAEALGYMEKISSPETISQLASAYDAATGVLKFGATVPFPGYQFKNLLGDTTLSWLGDAADPSVLGDVVARFRTPAWIQQMERLNLIRGSQAKEALEQIGSFTPANKLINRLGERFPRLGTAMEKFKGYTQLSETFTRTWHYLSRIKAGDTPAEAARSVRKWLLDYSELTTFEKAFARRAFFFYQWPRKILPKMLKTFVEKPSKMALLTRTTTQPTVERGPTPEFIRRSAAIPLGQNQQGDERYLYGFGSPLEELNKLDVSSAEGGILGGVGAAARTVGQSLNPLVKYPIESATGKDFFFDRDLLLGDKAEPILGALGIADEEKLPGGGTRFRGDPLLLHLLQNLPTARATREVGNVVNIAGQALGGEGIDPRNSGLEDLLQTLTGAKVGTVDKLDEIRTMISQQDREARGKVREGDLGIYSDFFPRGPKAEQDPEAVELLEARRELKKLLKALRAKEE